MKEGGVKGRNRNVGYDKKERAEGGGKERNEKERGV
jgi:hypothetical protein